MKGLSFLLGKWESREKTKGPDGKEIAFTLQGTNTLTLDGKALQIDEKFEVEGKPYANHIVLTHDETTGKYRAWWFSAARPASPMVFTGERGEGTFVLTADNNRMRINYRLLNDGEYSAFVEVRRGEAWETVTTAEYRRLSQ